jgi:hypothetical protein
MLASIGWTQADIPQLIASLKGAGALARDWMVPDGILGWALLAWLITLALLFWKWLK